MKRILSWASACTVVLAFGLTGCDGGGDMKEGLPKESAYVPLTSPEGSPKVSAEMVTNKPKKAESPEKAKAK